MIERRKSQYKHITTPKKRLQKKAVLKKNRCLYDRRKSSAATIMIGNKTYAVKVIFETHGNTHTTITKSDFEMDKRAKLAVNNAREKALLSNVPIAKYDIARKQAYLEYADGRRIYE